jgi:formylmethanofuran dehydrogenase subunit A
LGAGARADVTVYKEHKDKQKMFEKPEYVFKDGEIVARNGKVVKITNGGTHVVRPEFDPAIEDRVRDHFRRFGTVQVDNFVISDDEIRDSGRGHLMIHPCAARSAL